MSRAWARNCKTSSVHSTDHSIIPSSVISSEFALFDIIQGVLGKFFTCGYANQGQPMVYWDADTKKSDPPQSFKTVRSMFFMTERAMDLMVGGVE